MSIAPERNVDAPGNEKATWAIGDCAAYMLAEYGPRRSTLPNNNVLKVVMESSRRWARGMDNNPHVTLVTGARSSVMKPACARSSDGSDYAWIDSHPRMSV
jgi:hypothetical protein